MALFISAFQRFSFQDFSSLLAAVLGLQALSGHERKSGDVCCAQNGLGRGATREHFRSDL